MKVFLQRELREARAYAAAGFQALHICDSRAFVTADAPGCFKRSSQFAHLLDQDYQRLVATARGFGVRVIRPERIGEPNQHIDLCGKPLERAVKAAERWAEKEKRDAALTAKARENVLLPLNLET